MASPEHDYQARVEDYHSDDSDGHVIIRESLPRKASPTAQANVSTKRSNDLKPEKVPAPEKMVPVNIDLRSDSGYSSFTAASKSSADSAPSATSRSPPVLPTTTAPVVSQAQPPKPRRPTVGEQRQHSNESSPRQKPISRTASVSSKPRPAGTRRQTITQDPRDNRDEECRDPNCTSCGPNAIVHRTRPVLKPTSSTRNVSNYPSDQRSQISAPDPYYSPPSPTYLRQPTYASQGPAIIQTARTRRPSSMSRPRPQSFAGDPSAGYWTSSMPAPYPSPPQERGPPPSAYYNNMPNMPYGASPIPPYMGSGHPGGYYGQPTQPYDGQQRPQISARGPSNYGQRSHAAPIITQEDTDRSKYSARRSQQPSFPKPKLLQYSAEDDQAAESDYSDSEEEYDEREERRRVEAARVLMPPPKIKRDPSQRRPTLPHAKTTQVVDRLETGRRERRQSIVDPERRVHAERERERERERPQRVSAAPSRRASVSRPPPRHLHTQSEYNTRNARVIVNDSRSDRRRSYQPSEKSYEDYVKARQVDDQYKAERMREKRASRVVQERYIPGQFDDDDDEDESEEEEQEEEPVRVLNRPRRKTETDHRKGKDRTSEIKAKANNAEEYMKTRGGRDPWADQINKGVLKRSSRVPSLPSDSGSSHSSKASQSNQTTMTSTTNNEIRLRVDGTMPLSLQLSGDMEGRTLQLVPAENGMTDLVIGGGNSRSGETLSRSEKGSISGSINNNNRRSIIAGQGRRDAEDFSDRGSRSARSRRDRSDEIRESRDERGHVLRRTRTPAYH
jgi:hypothetical protein